MKTFNEYIAETTAPIIMDVVRMQKYDKSISIVKNTLKKRGYYSEKTKGVPARSINSDVEKYFEVA